MCAKLCDFGESKRKEVTDTSEMTTVGTPLYMAPEVHEGGNYSEKCDVYSFGMTMFAMLQMNGDPKPCFKKGRTLQMGAVMIMRATQDGWRPVVPPEFVGKCPRTAAILQKAWGKDPAERPAFSQMLHEFEEAENPMGVGWAVLKNVLTGNGKEEEEADDVVMPMEELEPGPTKKRMRRVSTQEAIGRQGQAFMNNAAVRKASLMIASSGLPSMRQSFGRRNSQVGHVFARRGSQVGQDSAARRGSTARRNSFAALFGGGGGGNKPDESTENP